MSNYAVSAVIMLEKGAISGTGREKQLKPNVSASQEEDLSVGLD